MPENLDRRRKMMSEDVARAVKMRESGRSYAEIGRKFSISEVAAKYWTNPEWRKIAKERARIRSREKYASLSDTDKKRVNKETTEILMRKRALQPEYKEYADSTHYRYAKTKKASTTRKEYYARNKAKMKKTQHDNYQKHREKRLKYSREYYKKKCNK